MGTVFASVIVGFIIGLVAAKTPLFSSFSDQLHAKYEEAKRKFFSKDDQSL